MLNIVQLEPHISDLLSGYVDESQMRLVGEAVLRRARYMTGLPLALDCSSITSFSGAALVELAQIVRDVQRIGSRLVVLNLDKRVGDTITARLVETLLIPALQKMPTGQHSISSGRLQPSIN